jgi:predicted outer membrane repeat protein
MTFPWTVATALVLFACKGKDDEPSDSAGDGDADTDADADTDTDTDTDTGPTVDADGDGYFATSDGGDDCDDAHETVHPQAPEICGDGFDNDCNPATVEDGTVGLDGVAAFATIQAALDEARNGSVVSVCRGTYEENLETNRAVTIVGTDGKDETTIDAHTAGAALIATGESIEIRGFTFLNGIADRSGDYPYGGALNLIDVDDEATIEDCDFVGNAASTSIDGVSRGYGGAVLGPLGGKLVVRRSLFDDNHAGGAGGAIYAAELELEDVDILENSADAGGGIFIDANALYTSSPVPVTLEGTTVADNTANANGGGMYVLSGSDVVVTGGTFTGNLAMLPEPKKDYVAAGGAVVVASGDDDGTITLADMTIDGNSADYGGGLVVHANDGTQARVFLNGVTVTGNHADYGAGMFAYNNEVLPEIVTVDGKTVFDDNVASSGGGGALVFGADGGEVQLLGGTFTNGESGFYAGGIFLYTETAGIVTADGVTLGGNVAGYGGDVTIEGTGIALRNAALSGSIASTYGGSIYVVTSDDVQLESLAIEGTECPESGGAIALYSSTSVDLTDIQIEDSVAQNAGAVYAAFSAAYMTDVTIEGSDADLYGGAVYVDGSYLSLTDSSLASSSAGFAGGALEVSDSNVVATNLLVDANYALSGGGIDVVDGSTVTLTDSTITSNTATDGTGGGAAIDATSTLTSSSSDWGGKGTSNDPDDVNVAGTPYAGIGADATFTCDGSAAECL